MTDETPAPLSKDALTRNSLKAIAAFEAAKGLLVLVLATGALIFEERIQHEIAKHLHHPGFNPSKAMIVTFALAYASIRFSEAYGLYKDRPWGQWVGIISGGLYLPFEFKEIFDKPTIFKGLITLGNILVIVYLVKTRSKEKGIEEKLDALHQTEIRKD